MPFDDNIEAKVFKKLIEVKLGVFLLNVIIVKERKVKKINPDKHFLK